MKFKLFSWSDLIVLGWIALVIFLGANESWLGMWSTLAFGLVIASLKLYRFLTNWDTHKDFILQNVKMWETAQLGHDLDDPYWKGKKRPTLLQKLKGIDPNKKKEEIVIDVDKN